MKDKYYDTTSTLMTSLIFISIAVILLIGKDKIYTSLVSIIVFIFLIRSLLNLVRYIYRNMSHQESKQTLNSCIFHLVFSVIFYLTPSLSRSVLPLIFAIYLIIIGVSQFIMLLVALKYEKSLKFKYIFMGIVYLSIAVPIFFYPLTNLDSFLTSLSVYALLLGLTYLFDFIIQILPIKFKNTIRRSIRLTLPKPIEAFIPYSVMREINHALETETTYKYTYHFDPNKTEDLSIFIHTSNRGVNRMGHIDIYFDKQVLSFSNYDEGSRKWKESFGAGVMFTTPRKNDYINFCIDNSKKTIFEFKIHLTDKQKQRVAKRIEEIKQNSYSWTPKQDKKYNNGTSYAAKLYKKTKAKFFKFSKGKYQTYFIMGTNCSTFADDIVGKSGMDILSINGIITPGTYYDYLNRQLNSKNSNVFSKEIYNKQRKAGSFNCEKIRKNNPGLSTKTSKLKLDDKLLPEGRKSK